ncbi:MAG TPA: hypothetical protein VI198_07160, partial [Candidatus Eisenbacteria bacterium]
AKQYWRRWSPASFAMENLHRPSAGLQDPPQAYPGSGTVLLDMQGRLVALEALPPPGTDSLASRTANWSAVLDAAGRDPARVAAVAPPRAFVAHADTVAAWRLSDSTAAETTLVAAAVSGHVVRVETYAGRNALGRLGVEADDRDPGPQEWIGLFLYAVVPLVGSIFLARQNLRARRGDVRGALVVGISIVILYLLDHLFSANVGEVGLWGILLGFTNMNPLGHALLHGVTMALAYLAIEPYVRRLWPSVLVSWARLVAGRLRDPIIGRDVLIGVGLGALLQFIAIATLGLERSLGLSTNPARLSEDLLVTMISAPQIVGQVAYALAIGFLRATEFFTLLVIFRFVLRNNNLAAVAALLFFSLIPIDYSSKAVLVDVISSLLVGCMIVFVALRYGYVASIVAIFVGTLADSLAWSLDFSSWAAPQTMFAWGIVVMVLGYGFMTAVGGKSLFSDPLSDPVAKSVRRT